MILIVYLLLWKVASLPFSLNGLGELDISTLHEPGWEITMIMTTQFQNLKSPRKKSMKKCSETQCRIFIIELTIVILGFLCIKEQLRPCILFYSELLYTLRFVKNSLIHLIRFNILKMISQCETPCSLFFSDNYVILIVFHLAVKDTQPLLLGTRSVSGHWTRVSDPDPH